MRLSDFVMFKPGQGGPVTSGATVPVLPQSADLPMPPNLLPAMPGTVPVAYQGPAPWGFMDDGSRCIPNVDGAAVSCCPGVPTNQAFMVGSNAITTPDALSVALKPVFGPGSTGNIAKNIARLRASGVDASMLPPGAVAAAEVNSDFAQSFNEGSYMPGSGQGGNLYGMGQADAAKPADTAIPWGVIAVAVGIYFFTRKGK